MLVIALYNLLTRYRHATTSSVKPGGLIEQTRNGSYHSRNYGIVWIIVREYRPISAGARVPVPCQSSFHPSARGEERVYEIAEQQALVAGTIASRCSIDRSIRLVKRPLSATCLF